MTTPPQHPDRSGFRSEDDIDQLLGSANPNPARVGCPGHDVLAALARRERAIGDPGYEHIVSCSPCYREFRALQQQGVAADSRRSVQNWKRWSVAAAAIVIAAAGVWFVLWPQRAPFGPERISTAEPTVNLPTELDLRKYSVTRSEAGGNLPVVDLPRGRLDLTIFLPVGSEPGAYEVQVLDGELRSRANALGSAEIRNYVTTLRTALDIRDLQAGSYQLAVRRQGDEWQMFPAIVK